MDPLGYPFSFRATHAAFCTDDIVLGAPDLGGVWATSVCIRGERARNWGTKRYFRIIRFARARPWRAQAPRGGAGVSAPLPEEALAQKGGGGSGPQPRQRSGEAEEGGQAPGGLEGGRETGERRSFPAWPPPAARSPSVRLVSSRPREARRAAEPSAAPGAPWGAPHSGPRCCRCSRCFRCCYESRRAAASQVGSAGQPPQLGARTLGSVRRVVRGRPLFARTSSFAARGSGGRGAGLASGHQEGRADCHPVAGRREPEDPLRLGFQGDQSNPRWRWRRPGEVWPRVTFSPRRSFASHTVACGRGPGGWQLVQEGAPTPSHSRPQATPWGCRARATVERLSWKARAEPLPHPPTPPAGDSEKVCTSGREVPAESGDMWQALG